MKKLFLILLLVLSFSAGYLYSCFFGNTDDPFGRISEYNNFNLFEGYSLFYRGGSILVTNNPFNQDSLVIYDRKPFSWNRYKLREGQVLNGSAERLDKMVSDFVELPISCLEVKNGNVFVSMPLSEKCKENLALITNRSALDSTRIKNYLPYRKKWLHLEECKD